MVERGQKKKRKAATEGRRQNQPIEALQSFNDLHQSWPEDAQSLLSEGLPQERRQELWEIVTHQASEFVDQYSWAVPDERALRILDHFSPVIEIGAGAGYWAHCMRARGIDCSAYDRCPALTLDGNPREPWSDVAIGGPEMLMEPGNAAKTLLLCYPDDYESNDGVSLAAQCLQVLQSDFVVHCGELFGDTASVDHAPWGRTTAAEAQQHLFSLFRCVLKVPLPSWPHCSDFMTVWRRMPTCQVRMSVAGSEAGCPEQGQAHNRERLDVAVGKGSEAAAAAGGDVATSHQTDSKKQKTCNTGNVARTKDEAEESAKETDGGSEESNGMNARAGEMGEEADEEDESDGDSEEDDGEGGGTMEFICDSRNFGLGPEGWAVPVFRHLL